MSAFKKGWDDIWNSFFEIVQKKLKLAIAAGQGHDISDSISFLEEARKLLQQNATGQAPKYDRHGRLVDSAGNALSADGDVSLDAINQIIANLEGGPVAPPPGVTVVAALGFVTTWFSRFANSSHHMYCPLRLPHTRQRNSGRCKCRG
jgi:hypothetical protein